MAEPSQIAPRDDLANTISKSVQSVLPVTGGGGGV